MHNKKPLGPSSCILAGSIILHDIPMARATINDIIARVDEHGMAKQSLDFLNGQAISIYHTLRQEIASRLNLAYSMTCLGSEAAFHDTQHMPTSSREVAEGMRGLFNITQHINEKNEVGQVLEAIQTMQQQGIAPNKAEQALLNDMVALKRLLQRGGASPEHAEMLLANEISAICTAIQERQNEIEISAKSQINPIPKKNISK